ncbi:unnamed protein product [Penicillium bialowiezense]
MCPDTRTSPYLHPIAKADTLPGEIHDDQIFRVIDVAANIQRLECMCLYAMHRDFVSAVGDAFGPSSAQRAAEPIIWLEEYRIYWALWQLENYAALSKVARSRWEWSKTSLRRLDDAANIDDDITPLAENICTVATVLESLGLRCFSGFMPSTMYLGHVVSGALRPAHGQSSDVSLDSFPFFPSLELLPLGLSSTVPGHQGVYPVWSPPELPNGKSPVEVDWLQIPRYRFILSPAATMYQRHCEMVLALRRFRRSKDLGRAKPYRLIGTFLWNFWRMYSVGLFKHSKGLCQPLPFRLTGVLIWNMWRMYSVGLYTVGFEGRKSTSIGQPDSLGSGPATLRPPCNTDLEWDKLQIPYPTRTKSSNVVELFGVAEAMQNALNLIDKPSANARIYFEKLKWEERMASSASNLIGSN